MIKAGQYNLLGALCIYAFWGVSSLGILNNMYNAYPIISVAVGAVVSAGFYYYYITVYRRYAEMI